MKEKESIIIQEAYRYFRKKRYGESIAILNKYISVETRSPYPHFLLCVSYLLSNRLGDAELVMNKLRRIAPEFLPFVQLEAFLYLKGAPSSQSAIVKYVEKLEQYPDDRHLKATLKILEKVEDFEALQKNARLLDYVKVPKPRFSPVRLFSKKNRPVSEEAAEGVRSSAFRVAAKCLFGLLLLAAFVFGLYYAYIYISRITTENNQPLQSIEVADLDLARYNLIDKIKKDKPPVFYYSDNELLNDFDKARHLIKNRGHNDALILLNKISASNANYRVMERIEFLKRFIQDVDDREYSSLAISTVVQKPYLYRGVLVKWKGRIANLKRKDGKMFFNLLVDYKNDDIFAGVIDVYSERDLEDFRNGDMVDLRATFVNTIGNDNRLYLVANDLSKI